MAALLAKLDVPAEERAETLVGWVQAVHSTAGCEVAGRLATVVDVAESAAALEVSQSHAETLAECGSLVAAAWHCRTLSHDGRASRGSRSLRPTHCATAAVR